MPVRQKVEAVTATDGPKSPVSTDSLMEAICDRANVTAAMDAVVQNKGAAGVDGMTVAQLPQALAARWSEIERQLLQGRYRPQPVRRVRIPKPDGGGRLLGSPTVIDRMIQQAVLQRLQPVWDPTFSEHSYGFRPGRSAHQAVAQAQAHVIACPWRSRKIRIVRYPKRGYCPANVRMAGRTGIPRDQARHVAERRSRDTQ